MTASACERSILPFRNALLVNSPRSAGLAPLEYTSSSVLLSGTMVKRATLVNEDQIRSLDIHEGDWVYVEKGGEIIPKITGVEEARREPGAVEPQFPKVCPDCGTPLVKPEGEARWFCPNTAGCPTQIKGRILHFLSRKAMNILAGEATVEQLYNLNLVHSPADLYTLTGTQLLQLGNVVA